MSLRINTNLPALTALRNVDNANASLSQSINRLSTGLRISTAADDPSGLVISEGMRAKLQGIQQAIMNSQDAVNMSKTAEGAMDQASQLLQNIRGVAVHAANSAVTDSAQAQADQASISSVIQSINRIATTTSWGNKKLLDGTAGITVGLTDATDVAGAYMGSTFNGMTIANGPLTVQQTQTATQTSVTTNNAFASSTTTATAGSFVINGYTFTSDGTSDTPQSLVNKINAQSANTGATATLVTNAGNTYLQVTSNQYGSKFPVNIFDPNHVIDSNANVPVTTAGRDAIATVTATVTTSTGGTTTTSATFTGGQGGDSGLRMTDSSGNSITLTSAGNGAAAMTGGSSIGQVTAGNVRFQIGPDAADAVSFAMPTVLANQLGTGAVAGQNLSTIDVTTQQGASNAITIIDAAIQQLASTRASLGAFQTNYLDSTVQTLNVANENLTSSESSIRDVDMASEMTKYTQSQVLQQAGISVLAQANQLPQQVLKLLGQ